MTTTYTAEVGRKFNADGSVHPFAGTTVISFLDVDAALVRIGAWLQEEVRQQPFGHKFSLLPLSSLHMTVIQLLNDQDRKTERWTPHLALHASMTEICAFMGQRVATVPPPAKLQMRYTGIKRRGNLAFQLEPANSTVGTTLDHYRDAIAAVTGVRLPDHEHYHFHISLAYRLMVLTAAEQQQLDTLFDAADPFVYEASAYVTLPAPQCTFFADMFRFVPLHDEINANV